MKMTKEIILLSGTYMFIETPQDATDFYHDSWFTNYINHSKGGIKLDFPTIIISTTKDIKEEQCQEIVEIGQCKRAPHFKNYLKPTISCKSTAKESLNSLTEALGLDVNNNYLILKKL